MTLLSFALGGGGFVLIGAHEALFPSKSKKPLFSIALAIFAIFFVLNSAWSLFDAHAKNDAVGTALQLQFLPIAFIFLLHSLLPLLPFPLPSPLLSLVAAFAFAEEFLLFYLQRKDPTGVENRYYDLLLVPIALCVFCTLLDLKSPHSGVPQLGRAVGLILHGSWLLQMGLSLFSGWVAQGCTLHSLSRGNYTLRCKDHPEYHRARAIATLQFNCHLALLLLFLVSGFSVISARNGRATPLESVSTGYAPIGAELQPFQNSSNFTLDSDDDETKGDDNAASKKVDVVGHNVNGNGLVPHTFQ
ncbi:hypothetical protein VNO78_16664 [Psophocarpus tetragonolobus]|uniref:Uncharacterized protein n=1 Tax=Psophocarpus tetragonolobus TaxID=3891 RepID=A0AAN9XKT3_PSOTE